jgi:two-component sensor histidine kinase/PAS domain-containing protein
VTAAERLQYRQGCGIVQQLAHSYIVGAAGSIEPILTTSDQGSGQGLRIRSDVGALPMEEHSAAFLAGGGDMSACIREFDWTQHALGPPEQWPLCLRSTLRLVLSAQHPMLIFWGPEHRCLYNDSYARLIGPEKHPSILGASARQAWPEIWEIVGPQIEHVTHGRGATWNENQCVWLNRRGWLEESYWTYGFSPIYDDRVPDRVVGTLAICNETTQQVLSDRRQQFLVELDDAVRPLADARGVVEAAIVALGRYLRISRVGYGRVEDNGTTIHLETNYTDGVAALIGSYSLDGLGSVNITRLREGATVVWHDLQSDPSSNPQLYGAIQTRALVSVPLMRDGRWRATLFVQHREVRRWSEADVSLIQQVATRLWDALERLRAEADLKLTTKRFELALEHSPICVFSQDLELRYTWIYNLPVGSDVAATIGRRDGDLFERAVDAVVVEAIKRDVINSGLGRREEVLVRHEGMDRYYDLLVDPLLDESGHVAGVTCAAIDITERKLAEETRKLLIDELDHRVRNTLALVMVLSQQTFRGKGVPAEVLRSFHARLKALGSAHAVLTKTAWARPALADLVSEALEFSGPARARIFYAGPATSLDPKQAVTIVMALHELCTNAIKYGALSNDTGVVDISWRVQDTPPWLEIVWSERGGPPVSPPQRRGFGSTMLEQALSLQLQGIVQLTFGVEGVTCVIGFPLVDDEYQRPTAAALARQHDGAQSRRAVMQAS